MRREWASCKRIVGDTAHIERARGTDSENREYCIKDGNYWEFGVPSNQGRRTDLEEVVETIKRSTNFGQVIEAHPREYIRYHRGMEKLFEWVAKEIERDFKTEVVVYWGDTGSGKSRAARDLCGERGGSIYYKPRGDWWDGYIGQPNVIVDDYYGWLKYDEILRLTDRYPHRVPIKGGYRNFVAKLMVFTSNASISNWYRGDWYGSDQQRAILRRVDAYYNYQLIENNVIITNMIE